MPKPREVSAPVYRSSVGVLSFLVWAGTAAAAQRSSAQVFPSGVDLVVVDVTVVDANGRPVEKLTQNDFAISENGSRQNIVSFAAEGSDAPSQAGLGGGPSVRTIAVILDDLNLTPSQAEEVKAGVADFLRHHTTLGDEVSLIAPGSGLAESAVIPDGRDQLIAAMTRVRGRRVVDGSNQRLTEVEALRIYKEHDAQTEEQVARRFVAEDAGLAIGEGQVRLLVRGQAAQIFNDAFARTKSILGVIERVVGALEHRNGRRQVVLASAGFFHDSAMPEFSGIVNAALRANAAIYFLDARGIRGLAPFQDVETAAATDIRDLNGALFEGSHAAEGAESLASDTGGFTIRNTNDLAKGFRAIADTSRAYYLIGYHSFTARDGKFQKIEVRLQPARRGTRVIARRGFFAPKDGLQAGVPSATEVPRVSRDEREAPPNEGPSWPVFLKAVERYRQGDRGVVRESWSAERLRTDIAELKRLLRISSTCGQCAERRYFEPFPFEAGAMLLTERDVEERNSRPGMEEAPSLPAPLLDAAHQILELIPDPDRRQRFERPWLLAVALHLFQRGQWPQALRYMDLGLQRYPKDPRLLLARGSLLETQGGQELELASHADVGGPTQSHRDAAWKEAAASRALMAQAEDCYRRALAADPGLIEARVRLGRLLYRMGQPEKALPELKGVIAEPDADPRGRYLAWLFLGAIREAQGGSEDALLAYQAAIALLPDNQAAYVALSHAFHRLGESAASLESLRGALSRADRRHDWDPWWVYPWGQSHEVGGRLEALQQEAVR
jgi:VWFA-related protein